MKRYVMMAAGTLLLCAAQAGAELRVIADLGGSDASGFYEAINRQAESRTPQFTASLPQGESVMLPVSTPEMSPGEVRARPLQLPGVGTLFLVGDDALSRQWLQMNADALRSRHAAGMVVNVTDENALRTLRELAPGVAMAPASGSALARRLQLRHYPVLITDSGLSQVVIP